MLSSSENYSTKSQRCIHFDRGHCYRGERCHFLHVVKIESTDQLPQDGSINSNSSLCARQSSLAKPRIRNTSLNKGVCRHFVTHGWCSFGSGCRYSHCSGYEDGNYAEVEVPASQYPAGPSSGEDLSQFNDEANGSKKICRFYLAGYCRSGRRCHFQHVKKMVHGQKKVKQTDDSADGVGLNQLSSEPCLEDGSSTQQSEVKVEASKHACDLKKLRETELNQFHRRYPKAVDMKSDTGAVFKFMFEPTDPDWPYDVKQMNMEVSFPVNYPQQMMSVRLTDNSRMPETVERMLTEYIQDWIVKSHQTAGNNPKLMFRPFLHWLDRNSESLVTDALKEYKRELMAKAAGVEFIPAYKLRELYPEAASGRADANNKPDEGKQMTNKELAEVAADEVEMNKLTSIVDSPTSAPDGQMIGNTEDHRSADETSVHTVNEMVGSSQSSAADGVTLACRKGTEVSLMGMQLTDGAATLTAKQLMLMVSCSRCTNVCEARLVPGQVYQMSCPRCHNDQLMELSAAIIHQMSSVVGWLNLRGCQAADLILTNCQFSVGCINCSEQEAINSISPGQPNTTWCRHCHQKLTVFVNSARFVQLSPATQLDTCKPVLLEAKKPVKAVRDPAIKEGQPLPDNGTCRHFKKSYRWLRFPCCGKAYPCDRCHDEKEQDHEMKLANRMICGFCAKEQPFSPEKPCSQCNSIMINKTTAYWEGGRGCRDQIKMSRNDPKKYMNCAKTVSVTNEKNTTKKTTKLRHA